MPIAKARRSTSIVPAEKARMQIRTEIRHLATETPAAAKYGRLEPLTGLRGVAACSVLIAHAFETSFNYGAAPIFHPFASRLAYFGMSLFFVLSGFVIEYNYADSFAVGRLPVAAYRFFVARPYLRLLEF